MIVTDIVPFDNKRSKIFIDGEFAFILYKGEIRELHLKTGEEITKNHDSKEHLHNYKKMAEDNKFY